MQLNKIMLMNVVNDTCIIDLRISTKPAATVQSGNVNALYDSLKALCLDKGLREEIGGKNRERALKIFNKDVVALRLKEVFEEL